VQPFIDSAGLLGHPQALRSRLAKDGFLFFRGIIEDGPLISLRHEIVAACAGRGWIRPGTNPVDAVAEGLPCIEGEDEYFKVYDDVQRLEALHALPHHPTVRAPMVALLGETAFPHPLAIARLVFPGGEAEATPPHQDFPNNQGTEDLLACWIPLGPCPVELGGLIMLRGSHQLGLLPREFAIGAGYRKAVLDSRHSRLDWIGGDFALGDAVVFHSMTVHRALPNRTDRLRLSVDYRFQREGESLTESCLNPHFGRLSWGEIYQGWAETSLQYYWRTKRFRTVAWDPALLDLAADRLEESMIAWMAWRRDHPERGFDPMTWFRDPAAGGQAEEGPENAEPGPM